MPIFPRGDNVRHLVRPRHQPRRRRWSLEIEALEDRTLLSASTFQPTLLIYNAGGGKPAGSSSPSATALTPAGMDQAYGINPAVLGDGTGETVAVVDAYDNPKFVSRSPTLSLAQDTNFLASDLHQFDVKYNLPEPAGFFTKVNQFGGTSYPGTDPAEPPGTINWEAEEALDVEWVHSIAPGAKILLVEGMDDSTNLDLAAGWAGSSSGAQAVSMSWSGGEDPSETSSDSLYFVSPPGHGVTFLAATGDGGATGSGHSNDGYPAYSPNVVAVGGTTLTLSGGNYVSEAGWSGSGGGISSDESKPAYQSGVTLSSTQRTAPDISFDANPSSGVVVYDSYNGTVTGGPWYKFGGTSLATPSWAGLIAIADQLRAGQGLGSLDGPSQTLPTLYKLGPADFHDIMTGNNGYAAGPGYDLVTGIGSPVPSVLLPDLAGLWVSAGAPAGGSTVTTAPTTFTLTFSDPITPGSLLASSLEVNGIAATGLGLDSTKTIATFTYGTSPVTTPGTQTLSLAAGAATQLDNSATTSLAYTSSFKFVPLALAVTSTTPAVGATIPVFGSSITINVNFNEAIDPSLVGLGNLTVSQGTVTAAAVLSGNQTVAYTISGLTTEGTLTVNMPAGVLKDQNDVSSVAAFSGTYLLADGNTAVHLVVNGPASVIAGSGFAFTVQAEDTSNHPTSNFSGTVTFTTTDPQGSVPAPTMVTNGVGYFVGTLATVTGGPWTITASAGSLAATSAPIAVTAGAASKLGFGTQLVNTPTGIRLPTITVQVLDAYGNLVTTDNSDQVTLAVAAGPGAFTAGSSATASVIGGVASFANLTLVAPGTYQLSATVPGSYTGPNSMSFIVEPLQVVPGSFAGTPSGFALQFNAPFLVNSTSPVLYGQDIGATAPVPSLTVTQTQDGGGNPVNISVIGSLVLTTATNSITFVATDTSLQFANGSPLMPDGTYTVVLHSTAAKNGFRALGSSGGFLDGLSSGTPGSGDFTATFTVAAAAAHDDVVWVPATADGPGQALSAPGKNQSGGGYPVYLNDTTGNVTDVQVTLNYNPALLTVTGVTGAGFTLLGSSTPGHAMLQYSGPPLPAGTQTPLGFITAAVPSGTAATPVPYKAKDLLHLSDLSIDGGSTPGVGGDALHLVAYVGDGDGSGGYSNNDAVQITRVSLAADSGFAAYPLIDPLIVADTDGSGFIPSDAALQANEAGVGFPTANLTIPAVPSGVVFVPIANNVDPSVSIPSDLLVAVDGTLRVPINIDDAHPAGSTGLIEAHLALTYDPRQFSVSAADVHPGTVLAAGSGWSVVPTIDPVTGQIAIVLSSNTPISAAIGGSLVTIDFHQIDFGEPSGAGEPGGVSPRSIELVASVSPNGQQPVLTELEDAQGTFTLSPAPSNGFDPRIDGVVVLTASPVIVEAASTGTTPAIVTQGSDGSKLDIPDTEKSDPPLSALTGELSEQPLVVGPRVEADAATAQVVALRGSAGVVFPFGSLPGVFASGAGLGVAPHQADPWFQALARGTAGPLDAAQLVGSVRDALERGLPWSAADTFDSLNGDEVSCDLEWQGLADPMARVVRRGVRAERTSAPREPASQIDAQRAALDRCFAQSVDDTDLTGDGEPGA